MPKTTSRQFHTRFHGQWQASAALFATFFLLPLSDQAHATEAEPSSPASQSDVVIIVGAPGTPEYGKQFAEWAATWRQVAEQANASTTVIGQSEASESDDRERLQDTIKTVVDNTIEVHNPLWLVLIGHGTFAQNTAKFNLRGPDVSASELAEWLQATTRPVVIVNCASASGPFINELSGENRVIVTATKSGKEQNYARFGEYLSQAVASQDSDLDHDGEVSIQEAFLRASALTDQFYQAEGRISTEHALIDDNADARGTPAAMFRGARPVVQAKDKAPLDGRAAARLTLTPTATRLPFTPAELTQRTDLETQLEALRQTKTSLSPTDYQAQLEPLMLKLSKLYQAAEQRQIEAN